ncbi:TetR/AcrR family transcriptional regulator [Pseudonocardia sp. CA-107938]|uniref:TetR/AcrR family transcriptional regulator n=1 Tax=Pseudonocardia sp. CA-107938 TaxID=3240021 RepID=UPI003D8CA20C
MTTRKSARRNLTTEAVVTAAADLTDEIGYDALTLAAVAERLGVASPSLYSHVGGLAKLRGLVAAAALRDFGDELRTAALGRSRTAALTSVAAAYRRWARQHPGRYTATVEAADLDDPAYWSAAQRAIEVLFALLTGYGITGDDAVDAMRVIRSTLHGFVELEQGGVFELPQSVDRSFDRLVAGLDAALDEWAATPARRGEEQ